MEDVLYQQDQTRNPLSTCYIQSVGNSSQQMSTADKVRLRSIIDVWNVSNKNFSGPDMQHKASGTEGK